MRFSLRQCDIGSCDKGKSIFQSGVHGIGGKHNIERGRNKVVTDLEVV